MPDALLHATPRGLHCPAGGFHVDPARGVPLAIVTHAHADHARRGSERYLTHEDGVPLLRHRLGDDALIEGLAYGTPRRLRDVEVSLHPAGHILGSSQVRVRRGEETWVVTGDFKRAPDPTCPPFEPVACDVLVTEATFGLPIYRWDPPADVAADVLSWWEGNRRERRPSVLFCYALGKAQRLLAELARLTDREALLHGAMVPLTELYRRAGIAMLGTRPVSAVTDRDALSEALVLAPPSAGGTPWMRRFRGAATGFASGWMRVRGVRRRKGYDRGFELSDHADWPALLATVEQSRARRVLTQHGYATELARQLGELGLEAAPLEGGAP